MVDDGVIKFNFTKFVMTEKIDSSEYLPIEECRKELFKLNLIGEYLPEKVGFGNISERCDYSKFQNSSFPQFLITGTQTKKIAELTGEHYTRVVDGSLEKQSLSCYGPIKASSESLTHGAIYMASTRIKAIVHVHHNKLWKWMLVSGYPKTDKSTPYGTLEMANEAMTLINSEGRGSFAMEGHEDGIVFYGESIGAATELALNTYSKFKSI